MLWILLLLGACGVVGVMVYNRLVIAQNQYRNAFSQIGVQLQRRHDLIPNLVAAAKGYLKHENDTFTQVTQARNQAAGVLGGARPENAGGGGAAFCCRNPAHPSRAQPDGAD